MSEKMSINVEVLGLNVSHNYMVPNEMNISKITTLIQKTLEDEYAGVASDEMRNHMLVQANTGMVLTANCSLRQLGIVNGENLIFL